MILIGVFCFICALQTFRLYVSYKYVTKQISHYEPKYEKDVFLIVPVLKEQDIIKASVESFAKLITDKIHVVYVTSAKEKKQDKLPTTLEMLNDLKKTYPIEIIDCPITENAVMAHQLNYAVKEIRSKTKNDFIIGIYNVDSEITPLTIDEAVKKFETSAEDNFVLQQYTLYPSKTGGILSHIALWQNRWTLHFELGRSLIGFNKYFAKLCKTFNYVIGHGLFFTYNTWCDIGGIPQDISNEDACMGVALYANGYKVCPIRQMEYALIAKNIGVYVKQQSTWFNGPLYAFVYAIKLCQKKHSDDFSYYDCWVGSAKLFLHAVYWLVGPILIWILAPIYYHDNLPFLTIWYILALYHCYFLNVMTMYFVNKIKPDTITGIGNPLTAIVAYILHCIGPIYTIIKIIAGKNSMKYKYKTDK